MVDGINLSDMVQNQITFQPNIDMIQEFKVQTNAFSAEYGRNAGIIINGVSKSGTNGLHGTAYEFVRNDHFDAKNFFDPPGKIPPFKRNIFGYSVGGPIIKNKTFFFHSYEGRRGREVATLNTVVPTPAQRAARHQSGDPETARPRAGCQRCDRHSLRRLRRAPAHAESGDRPHRSQLQREELPVRHVHHQPRRTHRADAAEQQSSRLWRPPSGQALPDLARLHPRLLADHHQRVPRRLESRPHRFPAGLHGQSGGLRNDHAVQRHAADRSGHAPAAAIRGSAASTASRRAAATPRSSIPTRWPGSAAGIPSSSAPNSAASATTTSMAARAASSCSRRWPRSLPRTPSQTVETALPVTPALRVNALGTFVQDDVKVTARFTLNLGLRWEYNGVPSEIHNRLGVFDFANRRWSASGPNGIDEPYHKQFTNFGPRVGFAWDPFGKGKTVIRSGAGLLL